MARAPSPKAASSRCPSWRFPGGALIGCSAGFVNLPRIKGSHNAIRQACWPPRRRCRGVGAGPKATTLTLTRPRSPLMGRQGPGRSQRQADVVEVRNLRRHRARRARHLVTNRFRLLAFGTLRTASRSAAQRAAEYSPSSIRSRTEAHLRQAVVASSCPTPTTRRTSRCI